MAFEVGVNGYGNCKGWDWSGLGALYDMLSWGPKAL